MRNLNERTRELYLESGGRDIDAAIERDRKLLELHDRELEHVATLPFDQHYRWRVAPSLMLRAQKDLEHQLNRRDELMMICASRARCEAPAAEPASQDEEILRAAASLEATLNGVVQMLAQHGVDVSEDAVDAEEPALPEAA